jgi:hypothetical protein
MSHPAFSRGSTKDRITVAVASPLLGILATGGFVATKATFQATASADWTDRLAGLTLSTVFTEFFGVALTFLALAFLWAVFQLRWLELCLRWVSNKVWQSLCLLVGGFLLILLIAVVPG